MPTAVPPHALVVPAGPEDDGIVAEQHEDQEHGVEPARPPLSEARVREMTAGLREAMDDVRHSVAVLAARVRDAHAARALAAIHRAVTTGPETFRVRDTSPGTADALDYGLSQRTLVAVGGQDLSAPAVDVTFAAERLLTSDPSDSERATAELLDYVASRR
ncbi:hypothetical protein [Streptomyces sp. NPDC002559]